ncbi:MAG: class I SAM-dependent methyltransferase [Clostridia bacterium]|nr:class I SAM-dependent methyltransferase [Clostridia bacterium]
MKEYYEAYDQRYQQVHERGLEWFSGQPTPIVGEALARLGVPGDSSMLEIGCGEGGDAAFLLEKGCNVTATDVSPAAIAHCRAKYPQWAERFSVLDCLKDETTARYDFIYAVAVLHMLVPDEDRQRLLSFIREHLTEEGVGLVVVMGDGEISRATDIASAFDLQERTHGQSGQKMLLTSTSCRIVTRDEFREEIQRVGLHIAEMGNTSWDDAPFAMYAIVRKQHAQA